MWTRFMDMHSGGRTKEQGFEYIYIEAPQQEAELIFYNRFRHSPHRVTCTCCGEDYSISEEKTLEQATAYERGCRYDKKENKYVEEGDKEHSYRKYVSLQQYLKNEKQVLTIKKSEIKDEERLGTVPEQGYVWVG